MKNQLTHIISGIPLVDKEWGGFYKASTYLLIGIRKSGKSLLALQSAAENANRGQICLFFTTLRPRDIILMGASININVEELMQKGLIVLIRLAPYTDPNEQFNQGGYFDRYMSDVVNLTNQYYPQFIVYDELTHFLGFDKVNQMERVFKSTVEFIEDNGITSMFIVREPASPIAEQIVNGFGESVAGKILLNERNINETENKEKIMTIVPNVGHNQGQFTSPYLIVPEKGIVLEGYDINSKTENKNDTKFNNSLFK